MCSPYSQHISDIRTSFTKVQNENNLKAQEALQNALVGWPF